MRKLDFVLPLLDSGETLHKILCTLRQFGYIAGVREYGVFRYQFTFTVDLTADQASEVKALIAYVVNQKQIQEQNLSE